ncbi:hypothetical protein PKCBPO_00427 [Methylorubrum thiocyanatum]
MPEHTRDLALVFAGGNAVGAYHAGTYEALHGHGLRPDWVVGASIGAVTAAIIAGNTADPGYTATDLNNYSGYRAVEQAAAGIVWLADQDVSGPTVGFFFEQTRRSSGMPTPSAEGVLSGGQELGAGHRSAFSKSR